MRPLQKKIPPRTIEMSRINQSLTLNMKHHLFSTSLINSSNGIPINQNYYIFFFVVFRVRYQWSIIDRFGSKQCHIHGLIFTISSYKSERLTSEQRTNERMCEINGGSYIFKIDDGMNCEIVYRLQFTHFKCAVECVHVCGEIMRTDIRHCCYARRKFIFYSLLFLTLNLDHLKRTFLYSN